VIEKIIEKIGQEEWQELYDKYNDVVTTTGEVVIALRNLELENEQLEIDNYNHNANLQRVSDMLDEAKKIIKELLGMRSE